MSRRWVTNIRRKSIPAAWRWCWILIVAAGVFELAPARAAGADDEEIVRRRELLVNHIPRHRRLREMLLSIDQLQTHNRSTEALKTVQWILDQPFDTFLFSDKKLAVSVKSLAEAKLRAFPLEWRQQYERTYGAEARQLLEDARHRDDDRFAIEVLRRFGFTAAADDAAVWLALRRLDRGDFESAVSVLIPDATVPALLKDMTSRRLVAAEVAAVFAGNPMLAQAVRAELADRSDALAVASVERAVQQRTAKTAPPRRSERLNVYGEGDRIELTRGATPVLRPFWTASLITPQNQAQVRPVLDIWRSHLQGSNLAAVVPNLPIVVRDQVILRTYEGFSGFELMTGRPLWSLPCESSIAGWLEQASRMRRGESPARPVFHPEILQWWFSGNSQMGYASSDGVRLYFVDSLVHPSGKQLGRLDAFSSRATEAERMEESNRLLAFEIPRGDAANVAPPKRVWAYGRPAGATDPGAEHGRFFFGPPLPYAGGLLSIVETDREIRLMALQAETGTVLWEQPLAAVDRPAIYDGERAFTACVPVPAGGLILCPTQAGVLAAVDSVTGQLRWSYYDADLPMENRGRRNNEVTIARGRTGFAPRTLVQGETVVHLPLNSSFLHLLERETGKPLRSPIPRQRACSIAAVTPELVVLLEDQAVRAVKLSDGTDAWRQSLGPIVGTGIVLGTDLVVPLDKGRISVLDLATGQPSSWQPTRNGVRLGNLLACGDLVLALGPDGVAAFPQAQLIERTLRDKEDRLTAVEKAVMAVDLNLAAGRMEETERSLETALANRVPADQAAELQHLLRELLYHRLEAGAEVSPAILSRLKKLATTEEERGRFLARQAQWAVEHKDLPQLKETLTELAKLSASVVFPSADEAGWKHSSAACCRRILSDLQDEFPEFVREFRRELLEQASVGGASPASLARERFALQVLGDDPEAGPLRDALARRLQRDHRLHAAEMLWMENMRSADPALAADAAAGLVELWTDAGWARDAARLLNELSQKWSAVPLSSGKTGRDFVRNLPADHDAKQWQARTVLPGGKLAFAAIRATQDTDLTDVKSPVPVADRNSRGISAALREPESSRRLMLHDPLAADVVIYKHEEQTLLGVVDKSTNQIIHHWGLSSPYTHPMSGSPAFQGHFLPFGVPGEFRGYSLLELAEETPAWIQQTPELDRQSAAPITGPGGPSFLTFQSQNRLFVCHPADGSILWQRTDLEPTGGMYANPGAGIAGDERCLVVFGADQASYSLFDTQTGKKLRSGRWDVEQPNTRRAFGRKILRIGRDRGQWIARVWDPLDDRWELEQSLGDRNTTLQAVSATEIVWLTGQGDVRGYDLPHSQKTVDARLADGELDGMNSLRIVREGDRYYLNLQRNTPVAQVPPHAYHYAADDTIMRSVNLRDDLYGIDGKTGRVLWKRTLPWRTLLRLEPQGLPFLVLLSKIRDKHNGDLKSLLVEVLDAETGELLGRKDQLPEDRIVHAEYDGQKQTLTLIGLKMQIDVQLYIDKSVPKQP